MLRQMWSLPGVVGALAALTDKTRPTWWLLVLDDEVRLTRGGVEWMAGLRREWRPLAAWSHSDPREALEALESRGLAPPHDAGRLWRCHACDGSGLVRSSFAGRGGASIGGWLCGECSGRMLSTSPGGVEDVASVASLGLDGWLRAEALAGVLLRDASVAWRPMQRQGLLAHSWSSLLGHDGEDGPAEAAMREFARQASGDAGDERPPWHQDPPGRCRADARAAWPAIRELAAIGALPVRIDADQGVVSLAVEVPSSEMLARQWRRRAPTRRRRTT